MLDYLWIVMQTRAGTLIKTRCPSHHHHHLPWVGTYSFEDINLLSSLCLGKSINLF